MICSKCKQRPAVIFITKMEGDKTTNEGLCIKCAMEMNIGPIKQMMDNMGITEDQLDDMTEQMEQMMETMGEDAFQPGGASTFPFLQNMGLMPTDVPEENIKDLNGDKNNASEGKKKQGTKNDKRKMLSLYCTDLTGRARDGKLDRIIGRDTEIARAVQILCRRTKNNPCLIGEPGVGKTAIAEGLAIRIAEGNVPAKLMDKEIHLLDLTALVAGTQFRGQFESRIKGLVEEVKSEGNIILFIDEVHNLVGTGDAEGSMNAANILKPALSRGEIQVIGATTFNEYRKHIEKDAALERRFQPVKVDEPSIEDTYQMLLGIKGYYELFHRVQISDNLVYKAVTLSERYITDRFLPDKAIDLLDEACTCANLRNKAISENEINEKKIENLKKELEALEERIANPENDEDLNPVYEELYKTKGELAVCEGKAPELQEKAKDNNVLEDDLAKVINLWTGIPATKVVEGDVNRLKGLENRLMEKVVGQDEAVTLVANAIKRSRIQLTLQKRPASFIFVGPTGVGKTELVKQLSMELFDTPETLIRLDMSEFMEKHSVSRLIGSPPGYVGYDEAGQLTEKVRRKPYSIILFDEIEKAHPDVMNILLQILDEGKTNDAHGRTVSFANTVIIMTSNAGSQKAETSLGFGKSEKEISKEKVLKALNEFLRPEFIGRVDEIVVFNPLCEEDYKNIAVLMINEMKTVLKDKGIELSFDENTPSAIVSKMDGNVRGARDLRNVIRRNIEDKISTLMIDNIGTTINKILITSNDNDIQVDFE
ncbi:MAG: AAA family ATPase [Clostridia bacterium]|nr:AAA family ATPase [Clostridia bacterium]